MGNRASSGDQNVAVIGEDFINKLPNEMLLKIFDLLPLTDCTNLSVTCRRWNEIMNCNIWKYRLMNHYKVLVIDDVNEDISNCDPVEVQFNNNDVTCRMIYAMRQYPTTSVIPQKFISQMNSANRPIRIVLFGLGMESPTCSKKLMSHLLCGRNSTFRTRGMVPGGGIKVTYKGKQLLHLMTMYTNTKSVRETLARDSNVNVFTKWLNSGDDDDIHHESTEHRTANTSRLQPTIREMIRTADAFVYVSDSQKSTTEENDEVWLNRCQECLYLILEEAVLSEDSSRKRPLLILSCHNEAQMLSYSCRDIIHRFQLKLIERPWNVCNLDLNSLKEIENCFNWLIYHTVMQWTVSEKQSVEMSQTTTEQ